jgi:lipoprotein-releasing system permease protein
VILGVGVVCFVMSMHNGFEREIRDRLLGTTSHISIFPLRDNYIENYYGLVRQLENIEGVVAASPFIYTKAAIQSEEAGDGIIVRGIDPEFESRTASIADDIIVGEYSFREEVFDDDTLPAIILGKSLANRLGVSIGEAVVLYSMSGEDLRRNTRPRIKKFYVGALFETGLYEFDAQQAFITIREAQSLLKLDDVATGVHLKLPDIYEAEVMAPVIDSSLFYQFDVVPWYILHRNIFGWIAIEKKVLFLGFILIVVVAAFSIISTLVMMTMEKRPEIGILKTMGTTPVAVAKIFVYKGLFIGVLGVVGGWILALIAAYLQNRFELVSLPPDIYFISFVPIDVHVLDFVIAGGLTFVICLMASLYPATQAARLSVVEVLRQ